MGLIQKKQQNTTPSTTKGFYFGHTEAEGENKIGIQNFKHFFEDFLSVIPEIENEKFFFIGRKGSGKSAIAKYLLESGTNSDDSFADIVKYGDIDLEILVQSIPLEDKKDIYTLVFEWLILVRLARLLVKNTESLYVKEYKKLKDFLDRNAGFVEIDKYNIQELIEKSKLEVSIEVLKQAFGTTIGKYIDIKKAKAPFYKFVVPLKEIIADILRYPVFQNKKYYILFDDLDIKFKGDDESSKERLISLIRATREINTSIFKGTTAKVIIFLRNDIKSVLEFKSTDLNKIFSSYEILLNWYDHSNFKFDENQVKLKLLANKRIGLNFQAYNISYSKSDSWSSLFQEDAVMFNSKTSFKYLLDFTCYRPRDIILFLSEIGKNEFSYPIEPKTFIFLIQKYVQNNVNELKSEFLIHFKEEDIPILFKALKSISSIGRTIARDQALNAFLNFPTSRDPEKVLDLMIEYSVLIYKDKNDKLYFNYRDKYADVDDVENMNFTLHKTIYKYFYPDKI
jgi:hypothetical protein